MQITVDERRARLAYRHRVLPDRRTDDLTQIADDLVALHSSDPVTVYLSIMLRMNHPSVQAVEHALYETRSLIRHHAMRRTLWVATPEVVRLMHAAATGSLVGPERRRTCAMLAGSGIEDPQAWLDDACERAVVDLRAHGPSTARALGERVPMLRHPLPVAVGKSYAAVQSAHTRVLLSLGFAGQVLRARPTGTWVNGAYRYAATDTWLQGGLGALTPEPAAAELARRWLLRFGPATSTDLQWWMGWTVKTTKQALVSARAVPVDLDGQPGWLAPDDEPVTAAQPWVAVLPSLDPTTMGWKQRAWYLPATAADAFDRNGNAGATIWVDGRVVGTWAQTKTGDLPTHYFEKVAAVRRREVDQRLAKLKSMVGETRFSVRFPGRIQATIPGSPAVS
jgi:hypothetical protein